MEIIILVVIAILPPIAFLLYILHRDRREPEPLNLIVKVFLLGGLSIVPAMLAEVGLGQFPLFSAGGIAGAALKSFIMIAPAEEFVKLAVVMIFIWKNVNFNEENDGIVYVGTAAIGFALLENIFYVVQNGLAVGIMRSVTSIPLHTFTGVLMGYFVGMAKFSPSPAGARRRILKGYLIAVLIHGLYDTLALSGSAAAALLVPLVIALFALGLIYLKKGNKLSALRWDGSGTAAAAAGLMAPPPVAADIPASHGGGTYKIVISRIIFAGAALFWALLVVGIFTKRPGGGSDSAATIIAGGIILTVIPIVIGIVLELSYRHHRAAATA